MSDSGSPTLIHDLQSLASTPASSIALGQILTPLDGPPTHHHLRNISAITTTKQSTDIGVALSASLVHLELRDDPPTSGLGNELAPHVQQPSLLLASPYDALAATPPPSNTNDDSPRNLEAFQSSSTLASVPPVQDGNASMAARIAALEADLAAKDEELKREREELKREREDKQREIEARKQAEANQDRKTSFAENAFVFDHVMLDDMRKAHQTDRNLCIGNLLRNRALPHTISPDELMIKQCPQAIQWMLDIMGDRRCVDVSRVILTNISELARQETAEDEKSIEAVSQIHTMGQVIPAMLLALARSLVELERASQTSSGTCTPSLPWQKLKDDLPGIPWELMITKENLRVFTKPKDPFNVQRRESAAAATSSRDATSDIGNVDNDAASNKATTDNRKSYDPETSRLMTDFFFSLKDSDGQWVTFHLCEIKAYHVGNSWKLQEFFTHHQDDSSATSSGGHQWRTIDVPELARDKMLDRQALAGVSQCTSYIPAHGVPFEVLTTGLANVFFRIDHTQRLEQPDAPVNLLYYVVSGLPDSRQAEYDESGYGWKPNSFCLTLLYSLLRSLSAAFTTTEAERIQWSTSLAAALPTVEALGFFDAVDPVKQAKASKGKANKVRDGDQDDSDDHGDNEDKDRDDSAGGNGRGSHNSRGPNHGSQGQGGQGGGRGRSVRGRGSRGGGGARRGRGRSQQRRDGDLDSILDRKTWEPRKPSPFDTPGPDLCTPSLETATQAESDGESDQGDSSTSSIPSFTESVSTASSASTKTAPCGTDSCLQSSSIGSPSVAAMESVSLPYFSHSAQHEWDGSERYRGRSATLITQQWCSNACLLGLKNGSAMDPACPNAKHHCKLGDECQDHAKHGHLLSVEQLRADLEAELRYGAIVHVMEPIAHGTSSRCQLFRITHPKFGYALAAKGTHAFNDWSLLHEDWMYEQLRKRLAEKGLPKSAEGSANARNGYPILDVTKSPKTGQEGVALQLPISFGVIKPAREFCDVMYPLWPSKDHFEVANICNTFLLLSYHGHSLRHPDERSLLRQRLPASLQNIGDLESWVKRALLKLGVRHDDIAPRNLLWCRQLEALVMIDFEEARLR